MIFKVQRLKRRTLKRSRWTNYLSYAINGVAICRVAEKMICANFIFELLKIS